MITFAGAGSPSEPTLRARRKPRYILGIGNDGGGLNAELYELKGKKIADDPAWILKGFQASADVIAQVVKTADEILNDKDEFPAGGTISGIGVGNTLAADMLSVAKAALRTSGHAKTPLSQADTAGTKDAALKAFQSLQRGA